jgi:hypothetical protein
VDKKTLAFFVTSNAAVGRSGSRNSLTGVGYNPPHMRRYLDRTVAFVALAATAWSVGSPVGVAGSLEPLTRIVHVIARNRAGGFLPDLVPGDLTVEEGGGARTIVGVARATDPVSIALLTEGALVRRSQVGMALGAFVRRMPDGSVFALYDLDGNRQTADSADKEAVVRAVLDIGASGPPLGPAWTTLDLENPAAMARWYIESNAEVLNGVRRAAEDLSKRPPGRRVVLVVMAGSRTPAAPTLEALQRSGATLYAAIAIRGDGTTTSLSMSLETPTEALLRDGAHQSGGRRELARGVGEMARALETFADDIANQYAVTYLLPDGIRPTGRVKVAITRPNATIHAPTHIPAR